MRCVQCIGHLDGNSEKLLEFHGAPGDSVLQRLAVEKLHGDKRRNVMIVNFVDGADVGMVQCGSSFCLSLKTVESLRILRHIVGQELQSRKAAELHVLGLVNDAHSASAELFHNAVMRDGLAENWLVLPHFGG